MESSIPNHEPHTPHTLHQCLHRLSHQKTTIIRPIFLNHMPLFGTIPLTLHTVRTHCSDAALPPTRLPLRFISGLCSFSISPAESNSSQLSQSFIQRPSHLLLLYTSITICTDAFSSTLPSGVADLTLIEISIHHR